jgi:hypothetical protein
VNRDELGLEIHAPLRGAAVGRENWVPPAVGAVWATVGRGFRDDLAAAAGVEGAQLCWRAVRRRRLPMDRLRPRLRLAAEPLAG